MLEQLVPKLDFAPPLADFLYRDPYKTVRGNIQYGFDLGQNDVNGRSCRTLAFVENNIDWQIWIAKRPAADAVQSGDHLQVSALPATIHGGFQGLGLRSAHCRSCLCAGAATGHTENSFRDCHGCQITAGGCR